MLESLANRETGEGAPLISKLGNDAVGIDTTVLYADISGSTHLVDNHTAGFAAEIYQSYLACAARIITYECGVITAYDGDRVMGVFVERRRQMPRPQR